MSKKLVTSYTFTAASKTIDSADFTSLEKIQLITNVTDNIIIYNFADATKGGTLSGTTLTLAYDTTSMADADKLQIFVEDGSATQVVGDGGGSLTVDGTVTASNVSGDISNGAADSGNPVKVGGVYNATPSAMTSGNRVDLQLGSRGSLRVQLHANDTTTAISAKADNSDAVATSATANNLSVVSRNTVYNGTTWDRMPGDTSGVKIQDGGNAITVDDGGGSLTVDGSVTANGALTNNNAAPAANNFGVLPAVANASTPTITEGNISLLSQDLSGRLRVQGTGATGSAVPGVAEYIGGVNGSGNLEGIRVAGSTTNTTTGILASANMAVFDDTAPTTITENQFGSVRMSANRNMYTTLRDAAGNERGLNIGASGDASVSVVTALPAGTNAIGKLAANSGVDIGDVDVTSLPSTTVAGTTTVAHDAADSGNGVKVTAKAESSPKGITLVADADRTDLYADIDGLQMMKLNTSFADIVSERVADTSGTSTAFTNFSAVANTRNYVTTVVVYNSSATAGYVDFRDGTAGSVLWTMPLPAGGGATLSSASPLFKTTANTALAYDVSAALSTVYISVSGFQSKAG